MQVRRFLSPRGSVAAAKKEKGLLIVTCGLRNVDPWIASLMEEKHLIYFDADKHTGFFVLRCSWCSVFRATLFQDAHRDMRKFVLSSKEEILIHNAMRRELDIGDKVRVFSSN